MGLKSYFWFQIELSLRTCPILRSYVWIQTELHTTDSPITIISILQEYIRLHSPSSDVQDAFHVMTL